MMYWGGDGWNFFGGLMMFLWWALVALAVVWLVRYAARNVGEHSSGIHGEESALDILKKRYAKGEIDKKQFDEMRKDIVT
jgi:putative membrane protein